MKKILALLLAMAMVFALAACGNSSTPPANNTPANNDAPAEGKKVGVFWYDDADAFLATVRAALNEELDAAGVDYQNFNGQNNQATQLEQVQTAVTNGFNLLVVNLVTSSSADSARQIIEAAGNVPVIFFNRAIEGDGEEGTVLNGNDNIAFIGTDAPEAGHIQGQMIGNFLVENYDAVDLNGDGVISYAMFMGDAANPEAIYRTQYGVEDANAVLTAAGKPALEYFNASNADKYQLDPNGAWSAQAAFDFMSTNLAEYSEANGNMIELIICNNDGMAMGAIEALGNAGYNLGDGTSTKIPVFGVDATADAMDAIAADKMTGTVLQSNTAYASGICAAIVNIVNGATPPEAVAAVAGADEMYVMADGFANKLFMHYAPVI